MWGVEPWSFAEIFPAAAAMIIGGRGNNYGLALGTFMTYVVVGQGIGFLPGISSDPQLGYALQRITYGVALLAFLWFRPQGLLPERKARWRCERGRELSSTALQGQASISGTACSRG
ncbi:MAG TPA: hypothetical protein VNF07_01600 [Acidimicrobiales bacterium]|nr:hypothetical protein [Acidimicrobiales bacterium]